MQAKVKRRLRAAGLRKTTVGWDWLDAKYMGELSYARWAPLALPLPVGGASPRACPFRPESGALPATQTSRTGCAANHTRAGGRARGAATEGTPLALGDREVRGSSRWRC